jgi:hypothetical protein
MSGANQVFGDIGMRSLIMCHQNNKFDIDSWMYLVGSRIYYLLFMLTVPEGVIFGGFVC